MYNFSPKIVKISKIIPNFKNLSNFGLIVLTKAYVQPYIPLNPPKNKKLPLIVYLHGGDFVLFSVSTVIFHNFCNDIASQFPIVVVSVEYRLAPENRIPAAFDDALNAILWLKNQSLGIGGRDPWLEYADFTKAFLLGSSADANIAYHTALRALNFDLRPLKIKGILLNQAYFGGVKPTQSETRLIDDAYVPLYINNVLWSKPVAGVGVTSGEQLPAGGTRGCAC
ncbi:hypothetical protein ACS0TY_004817 [Phlomoides rotata]